MTEKEAYDAFYAMSEADRRKRLVAIHLDAMLEIKKIELTYMTALNDLLSGKAVDFSAAVREIEQTLGSGGSRRHDGEYESPLRRKLERSAIAAGRVPNLTGLTFRDEHTHSRKLFLASIGLKPVKYVKRKELT